MIVIYSLLFYFSVFTTYTSNFFFILLVQLFNHAKQKEVICQESTLLWSNVIIKGLTVIAPNGIPPKFLKIIFYLFNFLSFTFLLFFIQRLRLKVFFFFFFNSQFELLKEIATGTISIYYKKI